MSERHTVLAVHDVSHDYGGAQALSGVSVCLGQGATALVGVNGAGKSTLLKVLAGSLKPTLGRVSIGQQDLYSRRQRREALEQVALMPQSVSFPATMTVTEVVNHLGWLRGLSRRESALRTEQVIDQVGLGDRRGSKIKTLSGGMVRRVGLAQALVSRPAVLLLDEPSTGLDPEQRRAMIQLVTSLDGTLLFSSHVIEDVQDVATRIVVLEAGEVAFDDTLVALAELSPLGAPSVGTSATSPIEAAFLWVVAGRRRPGAQ